jgi:hypothetical protein
MACQVSDLGNAHNLQCSQSSNPIYRKPTNPDFFFQLRTLILYGRHRETLITVIIIAFCILAGIIWNVRH